MTVIYDYETLQYEVYTKTIYFVHLNWSTFLTRKYLMDVTCDWTNTPEKVKLRRRPTCLNSKGVAIENLLGPIGFQWRPCI